MTQINATAVDIFNKTRFDEFLFYARKKKFLSNLRKNIKQFKYKYSDTIFISIHFPSQKCHILELPQLINNLNDVYSLFKSDPDLAEILGFFKYVNIIKNNEIDCVDVNFYTILHLPLSFLKCFTEFEGELSGIWEFNRYYLGHSADDKTNNYDYSTTSFQYIDISSITYLESYLHFYDLNNHYLNKTLLSVGGTMSQMMK